MSDHVVTVSDKRDGNGNILFQCNCDEPVRGLQQALEGHVLSKLVTDQFDVPADLFNDTHTDHTTAAARQRPTDTEGNVA